MREPIELTVATAVASGQQLSLPMVEVQWIDAVGSGDRWDTPENVDSMVPSKSFAVGYLWHESRTHVTLVMLMNDVGTVGHSLVIPKGMVVAVRTIMRSDNIAPSE
jgi:hypothetical protein